MLKFGVWSNTMDWVITIPHDHIIIDIPDVFMNQFIEYIYRRFRCR